MTADLRLGRWQDVLADVECDALICDPPYSERTHAAHGCAGPDVAKMPNPKKAPKPVPYASWSDDEMATFVRHWSERTKGWMAILTDHSMARTIELVASETRYVFAPVPVVEIGSRIRLAGDGPSSWTCWLVVSRPRARAYQKWGTLQGAYIASGKGDREHIGGKDSGIMRAIVRDYSRPGDLICDPTAGLATTGVAALTMGRRFIGAEMDAETHAKGAKRLAETQVVDLFDHGRRATQGTLFGGEE